MHFCSQKEFLAALPSLHNLASRFGEDPVPRTVVPAQLHSQFVGSLGKKREIETSFLPLPTPQAKQFTSKKKSSSPLSSSSYLPSQRSSFSSHWFITPGIAALRRGIAPLQRRDAARNAVAIGDSRELRGENFVEVHETCDIVTRLLKRVNSQPQATQPSEQRRERERVRVLAI